MADLAAVFAAEPEFRLILRGFGRFPGRDGSPDVLFLVPDPAEPFRRLTVALSTRWPEARRMAMNSATPSRI